MMYVRRVCVSILGLTVLSTACGTSPGNSMSDCPEGGADGGHMVADAGHDVRTDVAVHEGGDAAEGGMHADAGDSGDGGTCTPKTAGANGGPVTISSGAACSLAQAVTADRTLSTSECAVYDAPMGLSVGGSASPTLTIGPGVTIAFGSGYGLQVGFDIGASASAPGGLVVQGTECAPVVFTTDVAVAPKAGDWGVAHLEYQVLPTSSISNLILQYAGGVDDSDPSVSASLFVDAGVPGGAYGDIAVSLSNVRASNNYAAGMVFFGQHTGPSTASSGTLTVTDWPATSDPFKIFWDSAGMLSSVHLSTGTTPDGFVHLYCSGDFGQAVDVTQTWPSIAPLAYVLGESSDGTNAINIQSSGGTTAILTIAAPNTLRLGSQFWIQVDPYGLAAGALIANGTISKPIVFTSLSGSPDPGSWSGITLDYPGAGMSSITYATIDSAGSGTVEVGCGDVITNGAISLLGTAAGDCVAAPTLSNITFTNLPPETYGILAINVSQTTATALATTDGNTFSSMSSNLVYTCPDPDGCGPGGSAPFWQCC
jgi:hypothetical protein